MNGKRELPDALPDAVSGGTMAHRPGDHVE